MLMITTLLLSIVLVGCTGKPSPGTENQEQITIGETTGGNTQNTQDNGSDTNEATIPEENTGDTSPETENGSEKKEDDNAGQQEIDYEKIKPNESGKIMVVMFHRFIEEYTSGDKIYVTTFDEFRNLLQELYDKGYRLISMKDFLNNNINVPAGCVPIVFTFDDGTPGQFNLVEEDGKLTVNKQTAVGIMLDFYEKHPDFGLAGTFYVNLGGGTFEGGAGTLAEKLKYLIDLGFEIGNHTFSHVDLNTVKTAEEVQKELGANQKRMYELVPGYKMETLSLPLGNTTKDKSLREYLVKGVYDGVEYHNQAIMLVGANPTLPPTSSEYNPLYTARVRASGIQKEDFDLSWWLENISRSQEYVSDGNPDTITVPKDKEESIDKSRVGDKKVITY